MIVDMSQVSIAELRQNPTPAFDAVARGETVEVTRYRRVIGRIVPAATPRAQGPTGSEIMAAFAALPPDETGWAEELEEQRRDFDAEWSDPWQDAGR